MTYGVQAENLVKAFEGCVLKAYRDSGGVWTIGWGHTGKGIVSGMVWTQQVADYYLDLDLTYAADCVNELVVGLNQNQFDALVSFVFNLGGKNLKVSSLLGYVRAGDPAAAAEEFPKWDHVGKVEVPGLLRRRMAEQSTFLTPIAPGANLSNLEPSGGIQ